MKHKGSKKGEGEREVDERLTLCLPCSGFFYDGSIWFSGRGPQMPMAMPMPVLMALMPVAAGLKFEEEFDRPDAAWIKFEVN